MSLEFFTLDPGLYCLIKIGRLRLGWYHGVGRHSLWLVRKAAH
jgi:hypothetical protein